MGDERGAARPAHPDDRVEPALACRRSTIAAAPRLIVSTAAPAVPGRDQSLDLGPGRPRDLLAR